MGTEGMSPAAPVVLALAAVLLCAAGARAETVRLPATADIWVSDANDQERNTSSGKCPRLKLKSIQEMAAVRFDARPARGREVLRARLYLRRSGDDMLRYIRVSTVNADWVEGSGEQPYGPPDGATFLYADAVRKRPWAWPGSAFCDVVMSSGNSLAAWAERENLPDGWISVPIPPALVYALVAGDSDGLAIQEGGTLAYFNNFVHSVQSGESAPYIEAELGGRLDTCPSRPIVSASPAPEGASLTTGALRVTIAAAPGVFCYRLTLNGRPVERWRVKHPAPGRPTVLLLDGLPSATPCVVGVAAVAPGGAASPVAKVTARASPALPPGPTLRLPQRPLTGNQALPGNARLRVWACPGLVKVSPETGAVMSGDSSSGDYRRGNAVWQANTIRLFGGRGEYVSYQLNLDRVSDGPVESIRVWPGTLSGPGGSRIAGDDLEVFADWYARNRRGEWQPAYCVPLAHGALFAIPDPRRGLGTQRTQSLTVDVYVPRTASPGLYRGIVRVEAGGAPAATIPVEMEVFGFLLPTSLRSGRSSTPTACLGTRRPTTGWRTSTAPCSTRGAAHPASRAPAQRSASSGMSTTATWAPCSQAKRSAATGAPACR
jgi:hypothetical protein